MAAMRHSSRELTVNICTDPVPLDVGAVVDVQPVFGMAEPF
jgi:hypothetical protein